MDFNVRIIASLFSIYKPCSKLPSTIPLSFLKASRRLNKTQITEKEGI